MIVPAGYHVIIARAHVQQMTIKPFLRRPFVRTGTLAAIGAHLFQVGGLLAVRHARNHDAFGLAFFGLSGPPGAMETFLAEVATEKVGPKVAQCNTIFEYVQNDLGGRLGFEGDGHDFMMQNGARKIWIDPAASYASQCAEAGAALGAIQPEVFRTFLERTYAPKDPEQWAFARKAGLDIPEEQPVLAYSEAEKDEDEPFMEYCRQFYPEAHASLT